MVDFAKKKKQKQKKMDIDVYLYPNDPLLVTTHKRKGMTL
jgi:hypothetical protein